MDAKPTHFRINLSSSNDEKIQNNIVKKFAFDTKDNNHTCVVHNYVTLKTTGNTILS